MEGSECGTELSIDFWLINQVYIPFGRNKKKTSEDPYLFSLVLSTSPRQNFGLLFPFLQADPY